MSAEHATEFTRPFDRFAHDLPVGRDPVAVRRRLEFLERVLEHGFVVPGTSIPIGLDAIVGLIPVAGDAIGAILGLYLIWEARGLGLPGWKIARMLGNVGLDTVLGAVPAVGDLFDVLFRSNSRNMRIIRNHLDRHHPASATVQA